MKHKHQIQKQTIDIIYYVWPDQVREETNSTDNYCYWQSSDSDSVIRLLQTRTSLLKYNCRFYLPSLLSSLKNNVRTITYNMLVGVVYRLLLKEGFHRNQRNPPRSATGTIQTMSHLIYHWLILGVVLKWGMRNGEIRNRKQRNTETNRQHMAGIIDLIADCSVNAWIKHSINI